MGSVVNLYAGIVMAYGRVASDDYGYADGGTLTMTLFIVQGFIFLISLVAFSLYMWIRFDLDFWEWCNEIGWYTYWNCTYLVMITMILKAMLMVLGWYSVWTESRMLALLCAVLHPLMFILHLTGTIFICMYGVEESSALTDELMDVFLALVYKWDTDPRASRILKQIMEYVGCCGADGGGDFIAVYKPIPTECRHPISGNEWDNGCMQQLAFWLEPWTASLAGIGVLLCVSDAVLTFVYLRFRSNIEKDRM